MTFVRKPSGLRSNNDIKWSKEDCSWKRHLKRSGQAWTQICKYDDQSIWLTLTVDLPRIKATIKQPIILCELVLVHHFIYYWWWLPSTLSWTTSFEGRQLGSVSKCLDALLGIIDHNLPSRRDPFTETHPRTLTITMPAGMTRIRDGKYLMWFTV